MGSIYFYIVKDQPDEEWSASEQNEKALKKGYAYLLDKIIDKLPHEHQDKFPTLKILRYDSGSYKDEKLLLNIDQVQALKNELGDIIDILNKRKFLENVTSDTILSYIGKSRYPHSTPAEIITELLEIKELIDFADSNSCYICVDR